MRLERDKSRKAPFIVKFDSQDDRSAMAKGYAISSQVIAFALQIVLPLLLGVWLDRHWETSPLFLILGLIFGFGVGFWSLIRFLTRLTAGAVDSGSKGDERDDST